MLIFESKILFNNVKKFRKLLTEGVNDNDITHAIQNYEYVYIYYAGDDTIEKGYRTIRPFVLGTSTAGNKVLRAWQDKGKSDSLRPDSPRKRKNHEYFTDTDGKDKPGWRLFLVDKISSLYPTGRRFVDKEGSVLIPPLYNENDKQMTNIVSSISPSTPPNTVQTKGLDGISEPDIIKQKISKSEFDKQSKRFKQFYNVGDKKREATAQDIKNLYNVAKNVWKKSPNAYLVVLDNIGNFRLVNAKDKNNIPAESIVGGLSNLYSKYVLSTQGTRSEEDAFVRNAENNLKTSINSKK